MNLVEIWSGIINRQTIRRGIFTSMKNLNTKNRRFITVQNNRKHSFTRTKPPKTSPPKPNPKKNKPKTNPKNTTLVPHQKPALTTTSHSPEAKPWLPLQPHTSQAQQQESTTRETKSKPTAGRSFPKPSGSDWQT